MIKPGETIAQYTSIDKLQYINAVLSYIEKHSSEEITPVSIAERHFLSRVSYIEIFMPVQAIP